MDGTSTPLVPRAAIENAVEKARSELRAGQKSRVRVAFEQGAWLSVVHELVNFHPSVGHPWAVFSDPARAVAIVALGAHRRFLTVTSPELGNEVAAIAELGVPIQAPRFVGGLPFRPPTGAPADRSTLGDFLSPELLFWRRGEDFGGWVLVDSATDLDSIVDLAEAVAIRERSHSALVQEPVAAEPRSAFEQRVSRVRDAIAAGLFEKVVLARAVTLDLASTQAVDSGATLLALRESQPRAVVYGVSNNQGVAFIGATPELLVKVDGQRVETQALAGTRDSTGRGSALIGSEKDRDEQSVVARTIAEDLWPLCQTLTVSEPDVLTLRGLEHLTSTVSGRLLRETHVLDIAALLHPTPAVGGAPRRAAEAWLAETEPLDRGLYAGPFGFVDGAGDGQFNVAIRSARVEPRRAIAYAGAGIVAGSDPASEWQETELKLQTILSSLRVVSAP